MPKRTLPQYDGPSKRQKRHFPLGVDPGSGQRYAFTGYGRDTTVPDTDLEFEDDAEAIAYLNAVRQEANAIPQLLVEEKLGPNLPPAGDGGDNDVEDRELLYESGIGDFRGYFDDGAYIAAPSADSDDDDNYDDYEHDSADAEQARIHEIREAYYRSLMVRFDKLRKLLHTPPPTSAIAALPSTHSFQVGRFGPKSTTFTVWAERVRATDPIPAQVAQMTKDGVLRVLRVILGGQFLRRGQEIRERTSRWVWALLARLPERGVLDHVEIGWVRDLGRRAVLLATSMADMAELRWEIDRRGGDLGVHETVDETSDEEEENMAELEADDVDEVDEGEELESKEDFQDDDGGESEPKEDIKGGEREGPEPKEGIQDGHEGGHDMKEGQEAMQNHQPDGDANADQANGSQNGEPMDLSDGEVDDGEVDDDEINDGDIDDDETSLDDNEDMLERIERAKARLLKRLQHADSNGSESLSPQTERGQTPTDTNLHATINMILTIVGEAYGQRDLLEFRHPFPQA